MSKIQSLALTAVIFAFTAAPCLTPPSQVAHASEALAPAGGANPIPALACSVDDSDTTIKTCNNAIIFIEKRLRDLSARRPSEKKTHPYSQYIQLRLQYEGYIRNDYETIAILKRRNSGHVKSASYCRGSDTGPGQSSPPWR
jgi:hypothetical protein